MEYIITWINGRVTNVLQMRCVVSWHFDDNRVKRFTTLKAAIGNANKLLKKQHYCGEVHVIQLNPEEDFVSVDDANQYLHTDRDIYSRALVRQCIKSDTELYVYKQNGMLYAEVRDGLDNLVSSAEFPSSAGLDDIQRYFNFAN